MSERLSREQFESEVRFNPDAGLVGRLLAHDAALRAELAQVNNDYTKLFNILTDATKERDRWFGAAQERQIQVNTLRAELARVREMLKEAHSLFGRHQAHFDQTGGSGTGCPVCIEQRELRAKHHAALAPGEELET